MYFEIGLIILGLGLIFLSSKYPHVSTLFLNSLTTVVLTFTLLKHIYPQEPTILAGSLLAGCIIALFSLFWPVQLFALGACFVVTSGGTYLGTPVLGQFWMMIISVPVAFAALLAAYYWHPHVLTLLSSLLGSLFLTFGIKSLHSLSPLATYCLIGTWTLVGILAQYLFFQSPPLLKPDSKEAKEPVTYEQLNKILAA